MPSNTKPTMPGPLLVAAFITIIVLAAMGAGAALGWFPGTATQAPGVSEKPRS